MTQSSAQGEGHPNETGADVTTAPNAPTPDLDRPDGSEQGIEQLPLDEVFGILKNRRRRYVLKYLADAEGQVSIGETAEQIAAWENDKPVSQISSSERKRVYVGLYQSHLPKMDGLGAVSFNKPRGTIDQGENAEIFRRYLNNADSDPDPPLVLYSMGLSAAGALVLGSAMILSAVTSLQVTTLAAGVIVVGFIAYAVAASNSLQADDTEQAEGAA